MSRYQDLILWIGLGLVLVYLFTDANVRNTLFNRSGTKPTPTAALTLADFQGLPSSVGNTQSNTGNTGSVQTAILI
jgi:hypothetical protein